MNLSSVRIAILTGFISTLLGVTSCPAAPSSGEHLIAPKIWDEKALATWALPVAGVNAMPNFYTEAEYYATPPGDLRTYPVYHPDREPAGYMDWLLTQVPKSLVEPAEIKSDADWARLGQRVFDELDQPRFRTNDPKATHALRDRDILKTSPVKMTAG